MQNVSYWNVTGDIAEDLDIFLAMVGKVFQEYSVEISPGDHPKHLRLSNYSAGDLDGYNTVI